MRRRLSLLLGILSGLSLLPATAKENSYVEGEVLVTYRENVAPANARKSLTGRSLPFLEIPRAPRLSGRIRDKSRTTAQLIAELKNDPDIEIVEPNYLRRFHFTRPDDTYFPQLWALENTGQTVNGTVGTTGADTRFLQAWNLSRQPSSEIVVAVIDTGMDITHPDLLPNLWTNPGEIPGNGIDDDNNGYIDDIHGYDFAGFTPTMTDSDDHGTHVAGIIAAAGKNQSGVIGLQFRAKILPLKASSDGQTLNTDTVIRAYRYVAALKQRGVNIVAVNASFGAETKSTNELNAINALRDAGVILCAAAGNDSANNDTTPEYPAGYDSSNVIAVASITQANGLSSFSNYGLKSVDLAAPGSDIFSTVPVADAVLISTVTVNSTSFAARSIEYSPTTAPAGITATLHSCGDGLAAADFPPAVSGNIALIQRGTTTGVEDPTFARKATLAKAAGAIAVIIYDNTDVPLSAANWTFNVAGNWLPALQVTQATGQTLLASLPATVTLVNTPDPSLAYDFISGTSMAAPQVSAAVAFAALNFPSETMAQRVARIIDNTTPVPALAGRTVTGGRLDLLKIIDTDGDGLPDWWETQQFGNLTRTATEDPDGDGFTNLTEFLSGTLPTSASSHLAITSAAASGTDFVLTFPTVAERSYQLEWSPDLETDSWENLGIPIIGTGIPLEIKDPIPGIPRRFYRLKLLEP